jgi:hypothetical protein
VKAFNLSNNREFRLVDPSGNPTHIGAVKCMRVGPNVLITGGAEGHVKAWSYGESSGTWSLLGIYGGAISAHDSEIVAMSTKCTDVLVTASAKGELKTWRISGDLVSAYQAHTGPIGGLDVLAIGTDNKFIATCGEADACIRLFSAPVLQQLYSINALPPAPAMNNPMTALKIVPIGNEHHLFVGFRNGMVQVYNMKNPTLFERLGVVDGHKRQTKVISLDAVIAGPVCMLCLATENGVVNWFHLRQG